MTFTPRNNSRRGKASPKTSKNDGKTKSVWKVSNQLSDSLSYQGQQVAKLALTAGSILYTNIVTTGVLTAVYNIQISDIAGFSARFASTFDEYRILGVDIRVRPVNASSGVSVMFFDEKNTTAPTLLQAQERTINLYSNSNASSRTMILMKWRAKDLIDLQYTDTNTTTVIPVSFKIYSDSANYAAPIVATPLWLVEPTFYVEFRGIRSQ